MRAGSGGAVKDGDRWSAASGESLNCLLLRWGGKRLEGLLGALDADVVASLKGGAGRQFEGE